MVQTVRALEGAVTGAIMGDFAEAEDGEAHWTEDGGANASGLA